MGDDMKDKPYLVHGGYIGKLVYYEHGFPIYRFPGGDCVGDSTSQSFEKREEAEKYCLEHYGHID